MDMKQYKFELEVGSVTEVLNINKSAMKIS